MIYVLVFRIAAVLSPDLRFGISNRSCSFPSHPPKISFIRFQCFVFHFVSYSDPAMSRIEIRRGEGEERKGKEREGEGKERKEKERKGKERKGKDRKGYSDYSVE